MATIGPGWADGAWVQASWEPGAWGAVDTAAGWPEGRKRIILPDGRRLMLTPQEITEVRRQIEAERVKQLIEIEAKPARKRKKAQRKEVQEIKVAGETPILLPPLVSSLPEWDSGRDLEAVIYRMLRREENDALLLLLMVS